MAIEATVVMRLREEEDEEYLTETIERALDDSDCIVLRVEQEEV